jgi:sarcosine oxidase
VSLARAAKPKWRDLESDSGRALLSDTGQLSFGPGLGALREAMSAAGGPFEDLAPGEATERYPGIRVEGPAIFEPESGVLAADTCLDVLRHLCESTGVDLREDTVVESVEHDETGARLGTSGGPVAASVAVVCTGHWTAPLLAEAGILLRLTPTLEQVVFLAPHPETDSDIPIFIEYEVPGFYGLPAGSPGLLKVALHGAGPVADPDLTPLDPDPHLLGTIAAHSERLLRSYHPEPVSTERCFYDTTPDGDFVVDRIGRVVVGAGTTGHGFKFGPLLGELLADLATDTEPAYDLTRFSARRSAVSA